MLNSCKRPGWSLNLPLKYELFRFEELAKIFDLLQDPCQSSDRGARPRAWGRIVRRWIEPLPRWLTVGLRTDIAAIL
jgi:hypothetical protein